MTHNTFNHALIIATIVAMGFTCLFSSCSNDKKQSDEIPVIDISKHYPKKEYVLQNIADVNYITLETNDDILLDKDAKIAYLSSNLIIIYNRQQGDIIFFDNEGKFIRKMNHLGQSGTEYSMIHKIIYDEKNHEIFVVDYNVNNNYEIMVYNEQGDFNRVLTAPEKYRIVEAEDYDNEHLIVHDSEGMFNLDSLDKANKTPYMLMSKKDGTVDKILPFKVKQRVSPVMVMEYEYNGISANAMVQFDTENIIKYEDKLILNELSTDTIFYYDHDNKIVPIVARTPSIFESQDSKANFIFKGMNKNNIFISTMKMQLDLATMKGAKEYYLTYDNEAQKIFEFKLINSDYPEEEKVTTLKRAKLIPIEVLIEGLEGNKLSGRLKEIADEIDINDNPILMTVKMKQ